mmetsp:Transcript_15351/g.46071  ORF Transcript_15351/g.46071 Transcript_15351/m.46071 type:complete len:131 (+) Transcript_15351:1283-1675(+)
MIPLLLAATAWMPQGHRTLRCARAPVAAASPTCCICINCKLVDRCKTYRWVEDMHAQPHVATAPDFEPMDPQIQVFIRDEGAAASAPASGEGAGGSNEQTIEYDVFGCDAFTEDKGRWLRLMPEADFIPT